MDLHLKGKVALVTGGSRGIGFATAQRLAEEGAKTAICARGEAELGDAAARIGRATGCEVLPIAADVTRPDAVEQLVQAVLDKHGTIDILINNAGTATPGPLEQVDDDEWYYDYNVSVMAMARLCRPILTVMKAKKSGAIINVTALVGREPRNGILVGSTNRAAVMAFTKGLANETAAHGIRVNGVNIGIVWTESREKGWKNTAPEKTREEFLAPFVAPVPMGRAGKPEEVADAIAYLCSERASYITGSNLDLGGGIGRSAF